MKKDTVFFDLDGTLTDPGEGITNCVMYALASLGYPVPPREELHKFIGPPLLYGFKEWYSMDDATARTAVEKYRERFTKLGMFENEMYDGIPKMLALAEKSGKRLFVVTSKPEPFARTIIEYFGIESFFADIIGANMNESRTDKEYVIESALLRAGAEKEHTVMVGDRKYDMEGAAANGIDSVGVLFGYGSKEELTEAGAGKLAATVEELTELLCAM